LCHAQVAFDNATSAAYADGWQDGDDGGFGFGPWNFDGSYNAPPNTTHQINSAHPKNDLGTAWAMVLNYDNGLARAGRALDSPLAIGQTIAITLDNPTEQLFFKGYTIRFNSCCGNICYGGAPCTPGTMPVERFALYNFNYLDTDEWGHWKTSGAVDHYTTDPAVFDTDTDAGVRIEFKLTGAETFEFKMTPLDNPSLVYTETGSLGRAGGGPISWIEFLHYDSPSQPDAATDLYISSMSVANSAASADYDGDGDVDGADFLRWQRGLGVSSGASPSIGDADGDGDVDAADLTAWKSQFGSQASAFSASVPEPWGCSVLIASLIAVMVSPARLRHRR
jgi:hypothetical protein